MLPKNAKTNQIHYLRHRTKTSRKLYVQLSFVFDCYRWLFVWFHSLASFFEDTGPEDNIVFSPYAPATIPCLVTCFKILILPTEKNFVTHGAIVSRLHVAVEYLSKFNLVSTNKTKKQLPLPNPLKRLSTITTTTSNKRASTFPDVTVKRFLSTNAW